MDARSQRCKTEYEGKHYYTKDGKKEFVITDFNGVADVTIEFLESGYIKKTNMGNIKMGLPNPFKDSRIAFETIQGELMGNCYKTNQGYVIKIIGVKTKGEITYQFQDEFGYIGCTTIQNIRKGQIRNPYHRNEFGGYLGVGYYSDHPAEFENLYSRWHSLIVRGNGARYTKYSNLYSENALYINTMVCEEWMCYNTFCDWFMGELNKVNPNYEYEIDKDLLYPIYKKRTNGYKLYSPSTCVLVPRDLNMLFMNFGKPDYNRENNRKAISVLAEKYYREGAITEITYANILVIYNLGDPSKLGLNKYNISANNSYYYNQVTNKTN